MEFLKRIFCRQSESISSSPQAKAFAASSILGAKSLAWQDGIAVEREPVFKHFSAGIWTLVYEVAL